MGNVIHIFGKSQTHSIFACVLQFLAEIQFQIELRSSFREERIMSLTIKYCMNFRPMRWRESNQFWHHQPPLTIC